MRPARTRPSALAAMMALAVSAAAVPAPLRAQTAPLPAIEPPTRAAAPWVRFETEHFRVVARAEFTDWARLAAKRLEGIHAAVAAAVGHAPAEQVTVLVDDPRNVANGNAISWLDAPQITLYPVPPDPRSQIGRSRDWGELLLVHEFAHVAHLARDRRANGSWLRWLPGRFGTMTASPRWVKEGYATVIEGQLTGRGRPASPLRAAVLREWAVSGELPTYAAINGSGGYQGGTFAYLLGSAFLEHLLAQQGDSALAHLWRRQSARGGRSFTAAFEQTFGVAPADAYARYVAELTADAIALERAFDAVGRVEGRLEARILRGSSDVAVSPDGTLVALNPAPAPGAPLDLVIWPTDTGTDARRDSARRAADERRARFDPEDLPPVAREPRGKPAKYRLSPTAGASYGEARWFADGKRLLVVRFDVLGEGSLRSDVFTWTPTTGAVTRVTHGAAIREAEPLAGDSLAVGMRCLSGHCDLVRIDLRSGDVRTLVAGDAYTQYVRPRAAPDGRTVVAIEQRDGRWRPVLVDVASGRVSPVGPDTPYDRYDATFTRDGRALLYVSEAGGIPQVVRHELADDRVVPLTRVFSAAMAPEPLAGDSALYFLALDARGTELRRVENAPNGIAPLPPALAAQLAESSRGAFLAQPERRDRPRFDTVPSLPQRGYGLGRQRPSLVPIGVATVDGESFGGAIGSSDAAGRFSWLLLGLGSTDASSERGGSARATLRLPFATFGAELVRATLPFGAWTPMPGLGDGAPLLEPRIAPVATWSGGTFTASVARRDLRGTTAFRLGASVHEVTRSTDVPDVVLPAIYTVLPVPALNDTRTAFFADAQRTHTVRAGRRSLTVDLRAHAARIDGVRDLAFVPDNGLVIAFERTEAEAGWRAMSRADVALDIDLPVDVLYEGLVGGAQRRLARSEAFVLGGAAPLLVRGDAISQRVPAPFLAAGELAGYDVQTHTLRLRTGSPIEPFAAAVRADVAAGWQRAAGFEARLSEFPMPFNRLPGVSARIGAAWLFDPPHADRVRAWAAFSVYP